MLSKLSTKQTVFFDSDFILGKCCVRFYIFMILYKALKFNMKLYYSKQYHIFKKRTWRNIENINKHPLGKTMIFRDWIRIQITSNYGTGKEIIKNMTFNTWTFGTHLESLFRAVILNVGCMYFWFTHGAFGNMLICMSHPWRANQQVKLLYRKV